jgi:transposase-like protein
MCDCVLESENIMSQHFLLSASARTLSLATVLRMSDTDAETLFASIRWIDTKGEPVCPHCGCFKPYTDRRPSGSLRFRCRDCKESYSLTSGTLFAFHKLPLRTYLAAIAISVNEVKGKNALALSRDINVQYKTAFVLSHKIREAIASEMKGAHVGGEGKVAEVDGAYFGGYVKPANHVENRRDRRLAVNQNGKRQVVVAIRERDGRSLTQVFKSELQSTTFIRTRVNKGTELMADEANSWNDLAASFPIKRINHQEAYSEAGACTNGAENLFSRLRRAEIGHHHHISGLYLGRYAAESAWRDDHRQMSNGAQYRAIIGLVAKNKPSVDFCGYWQRNT